MQEMQFQSLDQEDPLKEEMATHSSILAWRIPWTEKPGRLRYIWSKRIRHNWSDLVHTRTGLLDVLSVDAQEGPVKNAKVLAGSTMASCHFLQQFLFIPLDKIQITQQFLIHKDNSSSFREPSLPKSGAVSWTFTHTCLLRPHKQSIVLLHSRRRLRPGSLNKGLC